MNRPRSETDFPVGRCPSSWTPRFSPFRSPPPRRGRRRGREPGSPARPRPARGGRTRARRRRGRTARRVELGVRGRARAHEGDGARGRPGVPRRADRFARRRDPRGSAGVVRGVLADLALRVRHDLGGRGDPSRVLDPHADAGGENPPAVGSRLREPSGGGFARRARFEVGGLGREALRRGAALRRPQGATGRIRSRRRTPDPDRRVARPVAGFSSTPPTSTTDPDSRRLSRLR